MAVAALPMAHKRCLNRLRERLGVVAASACVLAASHGAMRGYAFVQPPVGTFDPDHSRFSRSWPLASRGVCTWPAGASAGRRACMLPFAGVATIALALLPFVRKKQRFALGNLERRSTVSVRAVQTTASGEEAFVSPKVSKATPGDPASAGKEQRRLRVLSGVQPTGDLHLGNYFGAIKNWVGLQEDYDTFFCVVDLHAITMPHKPKELREATLSTAAAYVASGIDPKRSAIFVQSQVPQHAQLAWLLTTQCPMTWLNGMTQFQDKKKKLGEDGEKTIGTGLYSYPVLMAADILLYRADKVPVGEDQTQHLILANQLAERMNKRYRKTAPGKRSLFRPPEMLQAKEGARVRSLKDGTKKMSKSDANEGSRINLSDTPAQIKTKIKKCKTDLSVGIEIDNPDRPEANNLCRLYALTRGLSAEGAAEECKDMNWGTFKATLTESLVEYLSPIQGEYARLMEDRAFLKDILLDGRQQALAVAQDTLDHVEEAMGLR